MNCRARFNEFIFFVLVMMSWSIDSFIFLNLFSDGTVPNETFLLICFHMLEYSVVLYDRMAQDL